VKRLVFTIFIATFLLSLTATAQKLEPTATPTNQREVIPPEPTSTTEQQQIIKKGGVLGIRDWTTDTWTAIAAVVAFIALIQPWVITAWRRFFRKGFVDIHETSTIEIGFSAFGATIGLIGTLRSLHQDMFVQSANVTLSKGEDIARRFEWGAFRNPKTVVGLAAVQSAEVSVDAPFSFMIATAQPYRYNIIFIDVAVLQQVRAILENFRQAWISYAVQQTDLDIQSPPTDPNAQQKLLQKLRRAYEKFSGTEEYAKALDSLNHLYYWEPATYELILNVRTARPNKTFTKTWSFTLLENDIVNLRNNVPSILEETAGIPITAGAYLFAQAPYS
jgi:hypothetical protein